jgi:hypothetical protein
MKSVRSIFWAISILLATSVGISSSFKSANASQSEENAMKLINDYEQDVAVLSPQVCGGESVPGADTLKRSRDAREKLERDAANLVVALDRELSGLDRMDLPRSQRVMLQQFIRTEETALKGDCPLLPTATPTTAGSIASEASDSREPRTWVSENRDMCHDPGPNDIFPVDP